MTLRDLFERLPWNVRKIGQLVVLYRWNLLLPGKPFRGVYSSFDDLPGKYPGAYIAPYSKAAARAAKIDPGNHLPLLRQAHEHLPMIVAMLAAQRSESGAPFRILDFGGGCGIDFTNLLAALPHGTRIEYHVVELLETCDAGRTLWREKFGPEPADHSITFHTDLPDTGSFDLVYAWSAVHYVPKPLDLLAKLTKYKPRAILIVHTPFTHREPFVRGQRAQTGGYFPTWVLGLLEVSATLNDAGYPLVASMASDDDYNVDSYPSDYRVPNQASLLFLPRQAS